MTLGFCIDFLDIFSQGLLFFFQALNTLNERPQARAGGGLGRVFRTGVIVGGGGDISHAIGSLFISSG